MPIVKAFNDDFEPVNRYAPRIVTGALDYNEAAVNLLKAMRKDYTVYQQTLHECKHDGREYLRWRKQEIKAYQRLQKAVTLWINWLEQDNDLRFKNWPLELVEELDFVITAYELCA